MITDKGKFKKRNISSTQPAVKKIPKKTEKFNSNRLFIVWLLLVGGTLALAGRLYQLQILQAQDLQKEAQKQQMISLRPYIPRRTIIDSQKNIVATDRVVYSLFVHPKQFKIEKEKVAQLLAGILDNQTSQKLLDRFRKKETGILLTNNLTEALSKKIRQLNLDGLELIQHNSRFYPQNEMLSQVLGYLDRDNQAQAGVELAEEELLERQAARSKIRVTGNGTFIPAEIPFGLLKLDDLQLQLTLDLRLQRAARDALKEKMTEFHAKRGLVIVMDVNDGSIIALVCEPTYNPNEYFKYGLELFKNWAVSDLYEPGSTFKSVNIVLALDAGIIQPNTHVYDSGKLTIEGWNVFNYDYDMKGGRGDISVTEVLQHSSNIGMIKIMSRLNPSDYYQKLENLGLKEKTGIDISGEAQGHLKSKIEFITKPIEPATAAFGQGISLTPLKLLQLHAAISNGGLLVTPHVVQGLVDSQGNYHWQKTYSKKRIFSTKNTATVLGMMETVVQKGSGQAAKIPGYRIAGKTGTSQKASLSGGYLNNAKMTSFVGILPIESPRYAILAVVDDPKGRLALGGTVAAPIVKSVMDALISIKGIPPSSSKSQDVTK